MAQESDRKVAVDESGFKERALGRVRVDLDLHAQVLILMRREACFMKQAREPDERALDGFPVVASDAGFVAGCPQFRLDFLEERNESDSLAFGAGEVEILGEAGHGVEEAKGRPTHEGR